MATPRTTRARSKSQTPMPAISSKSSEAYGAKGKTNLRSQVGGGGDFATAFGSRSDEGSDDTNASEDDQDNIRVSQSPAKQDPPKKRGRPAKDKAPVDLSVVDEEEDATAPGPERSAAETTLTAGRIDTDLDVVAGYGTGAATQLARPIRPLSPLRRRGPAARPEIPPPIRQPIQPQFQPPARQPFQPQFQRDARVAEHEAAAEQPNRFRVFNRALPRYVPRLWYSANSESEFKVRDFFLVFTCIFFLIFTYTWMPLPTAMQPYRSNFCWALKHMFRIYPYDVPPSELELKWERFKHDEEFKKYIPHLKLDEMQPTINLHFQSHFLRIDKRLDALENGMSQQTENMERLRQMLPEAISIRVVDGQYVITDAFWHALREILATDGDMSPLWKSYVERNEAQIKAFMDVEVSQAVDLYAEQQNLITRETFLKALQENKDWMEQEYRSDFQQMQKKHFRDVKAIAETVAQEEFRKSPASMYGKEQLEVLTKALQVYNSYDALHSINWFSPGYGAIVVPHQTSPVHDTFQKTWAQTLRLAASPKRMEPNPPIAALLRWEEATDCYCGTLSNDGSSHITVLTPKKLYPERLVIEHIPATGTLHIAAAPRIVEVWALLASEGEAQKASAAIAEHMQWHESECGPRPSRTAVCVARGAYDIHLDNHVQSFPFFVDAQALGLGINKWTVKVAANWGADFTCLYRLRLTGEAAV